MRALFDEWLAGLNDETKTKDMKRTDVLRLSKEFPTVSKITRKAVTAYCLELLANGRARATVNRSLSAWRGYWS